MTAKIHRKLRYNFFRKMTSKMKKNNKLFADAVLKDLNALFRKHKINDVYMNDDGLYMSRETDDETVSLTLKWVAMGKKDTEFTLEGDTRRVKFKI